MVVSVATETFLKANCAPWSLKLAKSNEQALSFFLSEILETQWTGVVD